MSSRQLPHLRLTLTWYRYRIFSAALPSVAS